MWSRARGEADAVVDEVVGWGHLRPAGHRHLRCHTGRQNRQFVIGVRLSRLLRIGGHGGGLVTLVEEALDLGSKGFVRVGRGRDVCQDAQERISQIGVRRR